MKPVVWTVLALLAGLCGPALAQTNPFPSQDGIRPTTQAPAPSGQTPQPQTQTQPTSNPFTSPTDPAAPQTGSGCGRGTALGRAEIRKQQIAENLCSREFTALDPEWIFILYYVIGFNEFLEERGSYLDPSGACARAAEPRRALNLIYRAINIFRGQPAEQGEDARLEEMLRPFKEDWLRLPFILAELAAWRKEGSLDAANIASLGLCGDPSFKLFWSNAIEYAQRIPGESE